MDKYIKCLINANEAARESSISHFEFSEPREAVIFSQWMGAILPIDEHKWFSLPMEKEATLPGDSDFSEIASESLRSLDVNYLLRRRYVRFLEEPGEESRTEIMRHVISGLVEKGCNPQELVLVELKKTARPKCYNEDFWKYIAGCCLRREGYLVTKRRPHSMRGEPDMSAYKTPLFNPLRRHKFVKDGCFLVELELPLIFGEATENTAIDETEERSILVEAKCDHFMSLAENQLISYLTDRDNRNCFDKGYITGPDFVGSDKVGVISNGPDGELLQSERRRKRKTPCSLLEKKQEALRQVERLVKVALSRNLSFSRLLRLCRGERYSGITLSGFLKELSFVFERMTVDDVCSLVQEERLNR